MSPHLNVPLPHLDFELKIKYRLPYLRASSQSSCRGDIVLLLFLVSLKRKKTVSEILGSPEDRFHLLAAGR